MTDLKVTRNDAESRYELHLTDETHNGVLAGWAAFDQAPGRIRLTETVVDPAFRGKGVGTVLASDALADIARRGDTIVPVCPFIADHLRKNEIAGAIVDWPGDTPLDSATQGESPA